MSHSPRTTSSDDSKLPPNPLYSVWDIRSREELPGRLYEAVDKRLERTQEIVPNVIHKELNKLDSNETGRIFVWNINHNVTKQTHELIDKFIRDWKGLRWWRFDKVCETWTEWFKKAKCWQDQNQHEPLGRFWCLIFDALQQYTADVAHGIFPYNVSMKDALQICLYTKCLWAIFCGVVRFERTRETPLLPMRTLAQSKEIQNKLESMRCGFTLSLWKEEAEHAHGEQKRGRNRGNKSQRANLATILNERCRNHALNVYRDKFEDLKQILPSYNNKDEEERILPILPPNMDTTDIDEIGINSENTCTYAPTRGYCNILRCESQRFSPLSDTISIGSRTSNDSAQRPIRLSILDRLYVEREQLRVKLADVERKLDVLHEMVPVREYRAHSNSSIPSPMRVNCNTNISSNASSFSFPNNDINEPPTGIEPYAYPHPQMRSFPYSYWHDPYALYDDDPYYLGQHPSAHIRY